MNHSRQAASQKLWGSGRQHERSLLQEYRDALGLADAELPSDDENRLRYSASVAHGLALWLATASSGGGLGNALRSQSP
jgi:hypothetical protein